jgi:hypothetical protein
VNIARELLEAKNLRQKITARKRLSALVAQRAAEGCDQAKVIAGVKAAMTRIVRKRRLKIAPQTLKLFAWCAFGALKGNAILRTSSERRH